MTGDGRPLIDVAHVETVGSRRPDAVRDGWRDESLRTIWLRPGDWDHPAVGAVVEAVLAGTGVLGAVEALGAARAGAGVGIGETIDDLTCLYRVLHDAEPPTEVVRALCEGWASPAGTPFQPMSCMDPESGLPTVDYLVVRLREEMARVRREDALPSEELRLVLVDVVRSGVGPWDRMARSAAVGHAIETCFGPEHPAASLGGGVFAVLVRTGDAPVATSDLRAAIEEHAQTFGVADIIRRPPRVWVVELPDDHSAAAAALRASARADSPGPRSSP